MYHRNSLYFFLSFFIFFFFLGYVYFKLRSFEGDIFHAQIFNNGHELFDTQWQWQRFFLIFKPFLSLEGEKRVLEIYSNLDVVWLLCWIVAYRAWGYAGLRICGVALCGYEMEGFRAYVCGFLGYAPSRGFVVFTPYAGWQGIGFMASFTPYAIAHMGSLYFVEVLVPWITEDHRSAAGGGGTELCNLT